MNGPFVLPRQSTQRSDMRTIEIDCHAYAWHLTDPDYSECGPDNLVRMAETYGVLIRFLPDHPLNGWAWWYEITGPRDHIVRLLTEEYCSEEAIAEEMVR